MHKKISTGLSGEPRIGDLLNDPILHLLMKRDGITRKSLTQLISRVRRSIKSHP